MASILNYLEKIGDALLSFNFLSDFLDIFLVAFIIYEGIKLVRGSRTFQLIKGIAILGVIYALVKLFNMEASEYILSVLFQNGLIILVVLFSPELRNILEKFGRRSFSNISFFGLRNTASLEKETTATINDFCKSAGDLSDSKTGALVVFEKDAPLQEIIKTGTILDAQSSPELFNGLFFKNSALHDGAVVVRDARIYAAGCILPLTQNNTIDSELGTRHRAAIGMSEQSDAVVVIVTEETGAISVAVNGVLTRDVTRGKLREMLLSELIPQTNEEEGTGKINFIKKLGKNKNGGKKDEN
ncbi:MAG: diadenylate cyclase CdaA [Acutalibacteraceae bacterium]|nr:diadenylate cyclase CdaA [Acutalibacteraceae bacterium]